MRRIGIALLCLLLLPVGALATPNATGRIRVGVGVADDTWHVGTGSGQYAQKSPNALGLVTGDETDPFNHGLVQEHSYGVQSRLSYRTVVVEGSNGHRVAFVKSDHYLAQDALVRRAAQILDVDLLNPTGVHYDDIMLSASHNHSSPYYATPSWGVWLFQDAFDIRAFEYEARQMALSIKNAVANLQPARMGATVIKHYIYKGQIAGATLGDDGSPAGYPETKIDPDGTVHPGHADYGVSIVRFDNTVTGDPIAILANMGQHPESNDGYALITGDFLAPLERMVQRDTGAVLVFNQGDVGSAEGPYFRGNNDVLPDGVVRAWAHVGHAQTERGARYLANDIVKAWNEIGRNEGLVKYSDDFVVKSGRAFVPGPASHPYPAVSNCRTEPTSQGRYGSPILGLPDCARHDDVFGLADDDTLPKGPNTELYEHLKELGVYVPENYDAASFGGVQENMRIHIQAFRLGEVILASCSCEAQMDLILNFESRADDVTDNIFDGFEYPCTDNGNGTWNCKQGSYLQTTVPVTDAEHARMLAQIHNDAKGWDDPAYAPFANGEPLDPAAIKGNFTKEEIQDLPDSNDDPTKGYKLAIGLGHTGDYNGYVVSYREFMIRDHYRKALTAWGPHTADYMVTRMVRLAASLQDDGPAPEIHDTLGTPDEVRETAFMAALGVASAAAYEAWLASLPADAPPVALTQPANITRFQAATFTWSGGSNATDNPVVAVEKLENGVWKQFADQSGEVQTMVRFPEGAEGAVSAHAEQFQWKWTANFEAFDAFPRTAIPGGQTPAGTYRFVVDGNRKPSRAALAPVAYHLESNPFTVSPWQGITASDPQRAGDTISFVVTDKYPRTYVSGFRYIKDDGNQVLCKTCSFRPWASKGDGIVALVHVVHLNSTTEDLPATFNGTRWVLALSPGDVASILPGGITDSFGETNATGLSF